MVSGHGSRDRAQVSGGHGGGEIPVPIPNTEVKPDSADGTWGESPWESRTSPDFLKKPLALGGGFLAFPGDSGSRFVFVSVVLLNSGHDLFAAFVAVAPLAGKSHCGTDSCSWFV